MADLPAVTLQALPGSGEVLVANTCPDQRVAFLAAVAEAVTPYREQGAC